MIQFVNPTGLTPGTYAAMFATLDASEIVPDALTPVPEPGTWAAGILAVGALGFSQRKRLGKLGRRAPASA